MLTFGLSGANRVYDGTTAVPSSAILTDNRIAGDLLTISSEAPIFVSKAAGSRAINVAGISVTGADLNNYTYNSIAITTATIAKLAITGSVTVADKVYDGTKTASLATRTLAGILPGDLVTYTGGSAAFDDKNVGTGRTATASGLYLTGADAANYLVNTAATATNTATITPRTLVISATGVNRTYDGTTNTSVMLKDNRIAGDLLTTSYGTAAFVSKAAGSQMINIAGINAAGADLTNYTYNSTAITTATIAKLAITGSVTVADKVYDGTKTASLATRTLSGVLPGDLVTYTGGSATFSDKNVGTGKTATASGLYLTGADAANYSVNITATATNTVTITPRTLVISATASSKKYDGTTTATVTLRDNRVTGDLITLSYAAADFASATIGTGKTVTVTAITATGADAANYIFVNTVTTTASITA